MRLQDRVVFITDADSLSGKAILLRLAEEGSQFILNSTTNGAKLGSELEQCDRLGSRYLIANVNLSSSAEVAALLDHAAQQLDTIDVLVHNNRLVKPCEVETCEEELFFEILHANAKSAFITSQAAGQLMVEKSAGTIIFIGSIHAEKPTGSSFVYSAASGAVQMLSREASLALGRHGISVNHIQMGPVEGDNQLFHSEISNLYHDYEYKIPNAQLGTYDDLADLVLYLASDDARFVNGADIRLDGGFLGHYMDVRSKKP